jgi:hypothetical protein
MNDKVKEIFNFFKIKEEDYDILYEFLITWVGLQNIVSFAKNKEYYCEFPESDSKKECNDIIVLSDCETNPKCKIFKDICQAIEHVKTYNVNNHIKNLINDKIYKIVYINEDFKVNDTYPVFLVSENGNGIYFLNYGFIDDDYKDDNFIIFTIEEQIEKINELKELYNLKNILICGHSYGGYIAQNIGLHMENLDNVFFITSGVYPWIKIDDDEYLSKFNSIFESKLLNFGIKNEKIIDSFLIHNRINKKLINSIILDYPSDIGLNIVAFDNIDITELTGDNIFHNFSLYKDYLLLLINNNDVYKNELEKNLKVTKLLKKIKE